MEIDMKSKAEILLEMLSESFMYKGKYLKDMMAQDIYKLIKSKKVEWRDVDKELEAAKQFKKLDKVGDLLANDELKR